MYIEIDFESSEAIYEQLCNQIILGIAKNVIREGESLPSVRAMAEQVGVNMHTVNKAYNVLKEDGFLSVDRRRGAVVYVDKEKITALRELKRDLTIALAKASCKNIGRAEVHALIDTWIYERSAESPGVFQKNCGKVPAELCRNRTHSCGSSLRERRDGVSRPL